MGQQVRELTAAHDGASRQRGGARTSLLCPASGKTGTSAAR